MDGQRSLIHLGVGFLMIAASILRLPWFLGLPLLLAGAWFIAWGVYGAKMARAMGGSATGRFVIRSMDKIGGIAAGRDELYEERKNLLNDRWEGLDIAQKRALRAMLMHGEPDGITYEQWGAMITRRLVSGQWMGPKSINPLFKDIIAQKLRDDPQLTPPP